MSKQQTILEKARDIERRVEAEREETGARLKAVEYRCDTLLLELKNTVNAAIKMGKRVEALEARANTLTAHADPSIGLLPDKTSPL